MIFAIVAALFIVGTINSLLMITKENTIELEKRSLKLVVSEQAKALLFWLTVGVALMIFGAGAWGVLAIYIGLMSLLTAYVIQCELTQRKAAGEDTASPAAASESQQSTSAEDGNTNNTDGSLNDAATA